MNYLTVEELTEYLVILFDEYDSSGGNELVQFPSEDEIYNKIKQNSNLDEQEEAAEEKKKFKSNEPLAVLWDNDEGKWYWCIGFFICEVDEDNIKVDHLECQKKGDRNWIRRKTDDVQIVNLVQLVPIDVFGDWDFRNEWHPIFILDNDKDIANAA